MTKAESRFAIFFSHLRNMPDRPKRPDEPARTPRQQKREAARVAAEEDARASLLAAGYMPGKVDEQEAIERLLAGAPGPARELYTIKEFCRVMAMSLSTYHRLRRAGKGPELVYPFGAPRIRAATVREWLEANTETPELVPAREFEQAALNGSPQQQPQRKRRIVPPARVANPGRLPTIYDALAPGKNPKTNPRR